MQSDSAWLFGLSGGANLKSGYVIDANANKTNIDKTNADKKAPQRGADEYTTLHYCF
nr:hypothetical protein [Providencia alcalifaciens]